MTAEEYLTALQPERSSLLNEIHKIIISHDPAISATVGTMMLSKMILYYQSGTFKYGLASGKQYMSLHVFFQCIASPTFMNVINRCYPMLRFKKVVSISPTGARCLLKFYRS
jgi:hypothetical protein